MLLCSSFWCSFWGAFLYKKNWSIKCAWVDETQSCTFMAASGAGWIKTESVLMENLTPFNISIRCIYINESVPVKSSLTCSDVTICVIISNWPLALLNCALCVFGALVSLFLWWWKAVFALTLGLFVEQAHGKSILSLEHGVLLLQPPNSLCCHQMTMFQDEHTNWAHKV